AFFPEFANPIPIEETVVRVRTLLTHIYGRVFVLEHRVDHWRPLSTANLQLDAVQPLARQREIVAVTDRLRDRHAFKLLARTGQAQFRYCSNNLSIVDALPARGVEQRHHDMVAMSPVRAPAVH